MSDNDTKPLTEAAISEWDLGMFHMPLAPEADGVRAELRSRATSMLHSALAEIAELRERAEKAEAQLADERGARAMDLGRLSKVEAKLDAIHHWLDMHADVEDPDQRPNAEMKMLLEFFEDQEPAEPPKDREGDDVPSDNDGRQKCPNCGMVMEPFPTSIEAERDSALSLMRAKEAEAAAATARAEAAERRREEVRADAEKAGVAMLRRLLERLPWYQASDGAIVVTEDDTQVEVDRLIAEAEKPAEKVEAERGAIPPELEDFASRALDSALSVDRESRPCSLHGWATTVERLARGICELARQARKGRAEKPAEPPKDREGDDVLRGFIDECDNGVVWGGSDYPPVLRELCRRALGEER